MSWLAWIVVGLVAGVLAKMVMPELRMSRVASWEQPCWESWALWWEDGCVICL